MIDENKSATALRQARDEFVSQWGVIGSAWGVNRTMAQIHALLITAPSALSTDEVMAELKISRGNAHSNLRDLVSWGLVRSVVRKGERKEFFEAEKDVWKMFCTILRERRRRELRPALAAPWLRLPAAAAEEAGTESHGMSSFGDLKYPADFQRFDLILAMDQGHLAHLRDLRPTQAR